MRATLWMAAAGFLLAAGSAHAGPGIPFSYDDTVYPDDVVVTSEPPRVDVVITNQGGVHPRAIRLNEDEKLELVVTREKPRGDVPRDDVPAARAPVEEGAASDE